jgi:hypothetical protein
VAGSILLLAWQLALVPRDSQAVLRAAHRAQTDFEWQRRTLAPRTHSRPGGPCDELIGRFCYWYEEPGTDDPPPEPASITAARDRLIARLDSAAALSPEDRWIAGQRVRYLVEAGRREDAVRAARDCRATTWWCEALLGLANHAARRFAAADSVYGDALRDMPADERCRWQDLSPILAGSLRKRFLALDCDARAAFAARIWWLAQPLYVLPGNDRRTEHWARLTMTRLLEAAASPWGLRAAGDLRELIVRYGWPEAWTQENADPRLMPATMVGHDRQPAYHFLPDAVPPDEATPLPASTWTLAPALTRERYAPAYAARFEPLAPDLAVFRRGESTLVVVAYDLTRDTTFTGRSLETALVLATDERTPPVLERHLGAPGAGVAVAVAPGSPRVASFEVLADSGAGAARARVGLAPWDPARPGLTLSDLLTFAPADSLPADLSEVLPLVRGPARIARGGRIGLYWEVYGVAPFGETVSARVSVRPAQRGWLRRLVGSVGLGAPQRETLLEWQEGGVPRDGVVSRALVVDLATLSPGSYRIELTVATPGGGSQAAARDLLILDARP